MSQSSTIIANHVVTLSKAARFTGTLAPYSTKQLTNMQMRLAIAVRRCERFASDDTLTAAEKTYSRIARELASRSTPAPKALPVVDECEPLFV